MRSTTSFHGRDWGSRAWDEWIPLEGALHAVPSGPGLYRVRPVGMDDLAYVGETGKSLRGRLGALRRGVLAGSMPFSDPHTAAPGLWAWRQEGVSFEVSVSPFDGDRAARRGLECLLLWRYRMERGASTWCNHARFHPRYLKSGGARSGIRGRRLPDEVVNPASGLAHPALREPTTSDDPEWMGLEWRALDPRMPLPAAHTPVVYRILDERGERTLYVGQTRKPRARLASHRRAFAARARLRVATLEPTAPDHVLYEVENDVIAGVVASEGAPPRLQFLGESGRIAARASP